MFLQTVRLRVTHTLIGLVLLLTAGGLMAAANPAQKTIRIAIHEAPPALVPSPGNDHRGMLVDFLEEVAERENWKIQWLHLKWPEIINAARRAELDLVPFVAYSRERAEYLDYNSISYITGWGQVYVHSDEQLLENIFDFEDKTIAVVKDEIYAIQFLNLCSQFDIVCNIKEVQDYKTAFSLLDKRLVDGAVSGNLVGLSYEKQFYIKRTPIVFNPSKVLFASPKGLNAEVLRTIDRYLQAWKDDPSSPYYAINERWLGSESDSELLPKWLMYSLVALFALLLLVTTALLVIKQQLKRRTSGLVADISQLKQMMNLLPHLICATNAKGQLIFANRYAADFFGISLDKLEGLPLEKLTAQVPDTEALFSDDSNLMRKDANPVRRELSVKSAQAQKIYFDVSKIPFTDNYSRQSCVITLAVDVTERKRFEQQIQHMVQHDSLTALPNRLLLNDRISQSLALALRHHHCGAVLHIDLDHFKAINDTYGPLAGDKLLTAVAERLEANIRWGDTIARLGSDEFIIQLCELSDDEQQAEADAITVAEKLLNALRQDFKLNNQSITITASIGVVIYPRDADSYELIMHHADTAMYHAKAKGRNHYAVYSKALEQAVIHRQALENDLHRALPGNELFLLYQPQFDVKTKRPISFEALLRWNHSQHGIIGPLDFIPIAEEAGAMTKIGNWVIEQVCKQIRYWQKEFGRSPRVSINLSAQQLADDQLLDCLTQQLEPGPIEAQLLELEITEQQVLAGGKNMQNRLQAISELGVRIALCDVAAGHESLKLIKTLPLNSLKLDRSLIQQLPGEPTSESIVSTLLETGHTLGLTVIGEGVEDERQLQFLERKHCNLVQGYFFEQPASPLLLEEKYLADVKQASPTEA